MDLFCFVWVFFFTDFACVSLSIYIVIKKCYILQSVLSLGVFL